jgi:hypothetical protein
LNSEIVVPSTEPAAACRMARYPEEAKPELEARVVVS